MIPNIKQRKSEKGPKAVGYKRVQYRSEAKKIFEAAM
jgi:hypothetical protein